MPSVLTKQPWEELGFSMEFSTRLKSGVTISSINAVESLSSRPSGLENLTLDSQEIDGTKVNFVIRGGTDGEQYPIRVRIVDSIGSKIEGDGILKVIDRS